MASVPKGREIGFWAREKHEGRMRKEEGASSYPSFSLARDLAPKFPSLPFRTLATQASDNQVILLSYFYLSSWLLYILLGEILILKIFIRFWQRFLRFCLKVFSYKRNCTCLSRYLIKDFLKYFDGEDNFLSNFFSRWKIISRRLLCLHNIINLKT